MKLLWGGAFFVVVVPYLWSATSFVVISIYQVALLPSDAHAWTVLALSALFALAGATIVVGLANRAFDGPLTEKNNAQD